MTSRYTRDTRSPAADRERPSYTSATDKYKSDYKSPSSTPDRSERSTYTRDYKSPSSTPDRSERSTYSRADREEKPSYERSTYTRATDRTSEREERSTYSRDRPSALDRERPSALDRERKDKPSSLGMDRVTAVREAPKADAGVNTRDYKGTNFFFRKKSAFFLTVLALVDRQTGRRDYGATGGTTRSGDSPGEENLISPY